MIDLLYDINAASKWRQITALSQKRSLNWFIQNLIRSWTSKNGPLNHWTDSFKSLDSFSIQCVACNLEIQHLFFIGYSLWKKKKTSGSGRVRALNLTVQLGSGRVGSDDLGYGPGSGFSLKPVQTSNTVLNRSVNPNISGDSLAPCIWRAVCVLCSCSVINCAYSDHFCRWFSGLSFVYQIMSQWL